MARVIKAMLFSMLLALGLHASDLLSKVTGGSISDNTFGVKELSVPEMKDVLGGKYVFLNQRISTGLVQTLGYLDDAWYQENPILVVAEKYGKELTSGYHVYLTIGKNARIEQTPIGEAFVADQIPRDKDYVGLICKNIDTALKTLEGLRPQYGN